MSHVNWIPRHTPVSCQVTNLEISVLSTTLGCLLMVLCGGCYWTQDQILYPRTSQQYSWDFEKTKKIMAKTNQQKQNGKYRGSESGLTSGFIKYRRNTNKPRKQQRRGF